MVGLPAIFSQVTPILETGTHEDERTVLYKTKSLDLTKPNTNRKTKTKTKRPTTNRLFQTFAESRLVFRLFLSYLSENSFSSLLTENILHLQGFYQNFIFKINTVNLACELKLNCHDLRRVTVMMSSSN